MAHSRYQELTDLEAELEEIRSWDRIQEPKPGTFYLKGKGFLHFHSDADRRWADVRAGADWGDAIEVEPGCSARERRRFLEQVRERYHTTFAALYAAKGKARKRPAKPGGMAALGEPRFFPDAPAFRRWLEEHHDRHQELWVGFYKKGTGKASVSYPEARDEALCFGWVDGLKKRVDDEAYQMRFTPRRPGSSWSALNVSVVKGLIEAGRMAPPGLDAYRAAGSPQHGETPPARRGLELDAAYRARFREQAEAWTFFEANPPGYRRNAIAWVMTAKRAETRERRLEKLMEASARGERLPQV